MGWTLIVRKYGKAVALGAVVLFAGCASATTPSANTPVIPILPTQTLTPLTLSWSFGSQSGTDTSLAATGAVGSITVTPTGVPPFQGTIIGNCGALGTANTSSAFFVNVSAGFCVLSVQDGAGRFRAVDIGGSPPRAFLTVSVTGLIDQTGALRLPLGSTTTLSVNEVLVGSSFNTPYSSTVQGSCVTISQGVVPAPGVAPVSGASSLQMLASAVGQCAAVFTDAAGQATKLNITVG
jgi:hypothetical protein